MPKNRRSPTPHVIDVFISIDIPNPRTFPARNEKRFAANIAQRAHRRIYAAGDSFLCASKLFGRPCHALTIIGFVEALKRQPGAEAVVAANACVSMLGA